jgi:predicted nucleic acid-binding protein
MATTDDNALFVDTNLLVYANVAEAPQHAAALAALLTHNTQDFVRFGKRIRLESIG